MADRAAPDRLAQPDGNRVHAIAMPHLRAMRSLVSRNLSREVGWQAWAAGITVLVLSAIVAWRFGFGFEAGAALLLTWALVALSISDMRTYQLPDEITLSFLWLGLLVNINGAFAPLQSAVLGAVGGYLWFWIVAHGARVITGKEMLGHGDFKMLAMIGAWLGVGLLPLVVTLAAMIGTLAGIGLIMHGTHRRGSPIPFGPFLAMAAFAMLIADRAALLGFLV